MKLKKLMEKVAKEMEEENIEEAKSIIKERLKEINGMKRILAKAELKLKTLLNKDVEDVVPM